MSAFLCSVNHINLLANAARIIVNGTENQGRTVFRTLLRENLRSVSYRYQESDFLADWKRTAKTMRFHLNTPQDIATQHGVNGNTATFIVKLCDCFDYQSCETDDYRDTKAAKIVEHIRQVAIYLGGEKEGRIYDLLPWCID